MPINSFSPPRIVIDTNSPAHAESSPHVRRTLDINRESDIHAVAGTLQTPISIHALRKESDPGTLRLTKRSKNFNPHSPCGERRHQHLQRARTQDFNPHSPCGERPPPWPSRHAPYDFNPHSPCGERRNAYGRPTISKYFNPHSPCGERLRPSVPVFPDLCNFNPHSPCGERLGQFLAVLRAGAISIHTPLAGSDLPAGARTVSATNFNPHSPCGERRGEHERQAGIFQFQSTLPLRGATVREPIDGLANAFQSTLPLRGATSGLIRARNADGISIHTPLAGSDGPCTGRRRLSLRNFNPHSPCGERLAVAGFHLRPA